ncbi:MAG: M48 family metallopeptidase [Candidatus Marinarcus sp.]|uniref:M48 family metallopeptidase n=1 Tax=Candidatus Marinarcus sp. TaxID=3100987 RepID=UPI003B00D1C4
MNFTIIINNIEVTIQFIKSAKVKHCYMKIMDAQNIRIRANPFYTINDAKALVERKFSWLEKHITHLQNKALDENEFYYLGQLENVETFLPKHKSVVDFYRTKSLECIPEIVSKYSNMMSLFPTELKFRKNKSRWGSCSYNNSISLNIFLMKFPLSVIEYVVVHELAHIKHKNHSKKFWDFVALYCPHYKEQERLLKCF